MIQGQTLNTDDVGAELIGKTIETTFANGATITDRVVAIYVEINDPVTGRTGKARRRVHFEHVRPSRPLHATAFIDSAFSDWFELQTNAAIHVLAETEPTQ